MSRQRLIVLIFYLLYTFIAMFAPIKIGFDIFYLGLLLIWMIYILSGFFECHSEDLKFPSYPAIERNFWILCALALGASVVSIVFYTGLDLLDFNTYKMSPGQIYYNYQKHFKLNIINKSVLEKLPFILSICFVKVVYLLGLYNFFQNKNIYNLFKYVVLGGLPYLIFGLARGTNIEIFELFFFFLASLVLTLRRDEWLKGGGGLLLVVVVGVILYDMRISSRLVNYDLELCLINDFCPNKDALIYRISPTLGILLVKLSYYFTFGIYYISHWIMNLDLVNLTSFQITTELCGVRIECGYSWVPDLIRITERIGLWGTGGLVMSFLYFSRKIFKSSEKENGVVYFIFHLYYIYLLIALPVSNFIIAISSNLLILMMLGIYYFSSVARKIAKK